jgi:alpha-mannosidase
MKTNIRVTRLFQFVVLATCLVRQHAVAASSETKLLWRIGEFNFSSGEFRSQDIDYTNPKSDPIYEVGKSTNQDWLRFQPGPANGMTGGRLHPFTVRFTLSDPPRGLYRLRLAALYETPRLSHLRLQINGHAGLFYFHPKLDYSAGDWEGTFVPQTSTDSKLVAIPAEWMKQGINELVLTALDEPGERQDTLGAIAPGHTGIIYDALELTQQPTERYNAASFAADVDPTIFYQKEDSLNEVVDVFATFGHIPSSGKVEFSLGSNTWTQTVPGSEEFGEKKFEFLVPEWTGKTLATITFQADGAKRSVTAQASPGKKWTVFIIPHEHLDVGFTDYAAKVAELHSQSIDDVMNIMRSVPGFRWTLDGSWVADQYLAGRSSEAQRTFLSHVREGKIVIPAEFANQHTGNASFEGLIHTFYGSHQLASKYDLPKSDAAQIVDVPAYTWSFASVLHDAGIKYFLGASNGWRAPVVLLGKWNERSPFYWEGPDGGRVLTWYSRAYLQMHTLFGSPWRMESVRDALPIFLQAYSAPEYPASSAIIFGSQLENTPFAKEQAELPGKWNSQYAYPRLKFATVQTAMQQIEREAGTNIPVFRGDFGPYWEDGYGSDAIHTALHRENQERILTAEKLSVLPSVLSPTLRPDLSLLKRAWTNELTYDEHTWTYVGATSQPENEQSEKQLALKQSRVMEAKREIDESIQRSFAQLGGMLSPPQNSVAIFNSLSWERNGVVTLDLPEGFEIVDNKTKRTVPYELKFAGKGISLPGFGKGYKRVRFATTNIPALGYKLYSMQPAKQQPAASESLPVRDVVENRFYRLALDHPSGAIASIFDKQLGKELIDQKSPYKFGSYLYVTGGNDIPNNSLYRFGAGLTPPQLTVHPASNGNIRSIRKAPFGLVVTLDSSAVNTPRIQTEITLYDEEKKIEIRYDLHKERVLTRESAYIAFPFDVTNPSFTYGNQVGWVNPAKNELPGGSREWYVARHWTAITNQGMSVAVVPVDAPLVAFGDVVRGNWPRNFEPKSSTVLSWLMNNYWGTNFPAWQGGDFTFRYVLKSGSTFSPVETNRFAIQESTPLEKTDVPQNSAASRLPTDEAGLLQIDNPNVLLSTWKIAEDEDGTILRLQETAGLASRVRIHSDYFKFSNAWLTSALEDKISEILPKDGDLEINLRPFQTATIRVRTGAQE